MNRLANNRSLLIYTRIIIISNSRSAACIFMIFSFTTKHSKATKVHEDVQFIIKQPLIKFKITHLKLHGWFKYLKLTYPEMYELLQIKSCGNRHYSRVLFSSPCLRMNKPNSKMSINISIENIPISTLNTTSYSLTIYIKKMKKFH